MAKEKSIFVELLGDYPLIRILNHLLIFREFDYSLTDISKNSDVAWSTLNLIWPKLEKLELVVNTRMVGKAKMFKLNINNPYVAKLIDFADSIVLDYANTKLQKHKIAAWLH
jgi:hypothetical protein